MLQHLPTAAVLLLNTNAFMIGSGSHLLQADRARFGNMDATNYMLM